MILGNDAFAFASSVELEKEPKIEAKAYGRVEGRCLTGSRPVPDQEIELSGDLISQSTRARNVSFSQKTKTDHQGRFAFKSVIPSRSLRVNRVEPEKIALGIWSIGEPVRVEPGATAQVMLGGKGRPVIGRVELPAGWTAAIDFSDRSEARIESNRPFTPIPFSLLRGKTSLAGLILHSRGTNVGATAPKVSGLITTAACRPASRRPRWIVSDRRRARRRVLGLPSGSTESLFITRYRVQYKRNSADHSRAHHPCSPSSRRYPTAGADEPIDVGVLRLAPRVTLKAGEPAPAFKVTTLSTAESFLCPKIKTLRGKFLLIDFGTSWDIAMPQQITLLNEVYQEVQRGRAVRDPQLDHGGRQRANQEIDRGQGPAMAAGDRRATLERDRVGLRHR